MSVTDNPYYYIKNDKVWNARSPAMWCPSDGTKSMVIISIDWWKRKLVAKCLLCAITETWNFDNFVQYFEPIELIKKVEKKCTCGACKTSNPNLHSHWCDSL